MASRRVDSESSRSPRGRRASTPEERENQLIALATDEAERQIRAGTASSQLLTHYLKLASSRERLEQERIVHETALLEMKRESYASAARVEELYENAINAMKTYSGHQSTFDEDPNVF